MKKNKDGKSLVDSWMIPKGKIIERVRKSLELVEEGTLLDVGCYNGEISHLFAKKGLNVIGIDKDDVEINRTNSHLPITTKLERIKKCVTLAEETDNSSPKVKFMTYDVNNIPLPFPDSSFDGIYMGEVIEHCNNPHGVLVDLRRVLKPGGYIILSTPNACGWKQVVMSHYKVQMRIDRVLDEKWGTGDEKEHLYAWTLYTLIRLMKRAGYVFQSHHYGGSSLIIKARKGSDNE